jgi:glycosyltransferase involved in cell wall biosynthesis
MYKNRPTAVVIPCYNVANHIAGVLSCLPDFVDQIIVVNDASTDKTADIVNALKDIRVTVVSHEVNRGVGAAVVSGLRVALEKAAQLVVKLDGDGQMDPQLIPALLDPIVVQGYGYAKGNRFLGDEHLREMPWLRLAGSFILTFLTKIASGYWHVFDPVNGYVAIDADVLRRLPLDRLAHRYFFETDMLIHLNVAGARVKDVPMPSRYRDEQSAMRLTTVAVTFPVSLLRGFWYRLYNRHILREFSAVAVFWIFGILLLGWGTGFGAYTWAKSIYTGHVASTGTVMLSVLPFTIGFQLALQAILIEISESMP